MLQPPDNVHIYCAVKPKTSVACIDHMIDGTTSEDSCTGRETGLPEVSALGNAVSPRGT